MEQHTSRKSKVKLGTGQSASDIFISTKVTKTGRKNQDGSPIFTTEVIRYPSANSAESDGVVIATGSNEDGAPKISKTANITNTEERFLTSKITEVRRQQMGTISSNFNLNAEEQKAYAEAGGTDRNPISQSQSNTNGTDDVSINLEDLPNQITGDNLRNWSEDENPYYYPEGIRNSKQDYIQFDILEYKTKRPDPSKGNLAFQEREQATVLKTIILPIQPSISDSNSVDWNSGQINPVELAAVGLSGQLMNPTSKEDIDKTLQNLVSKGITDNSNAQKAIRLYLQQKAVGVSGLLSRFGGAVLNPNMELLFQGPQLRPFTFSFRLSPREKSEARMVKKIIRAFKESMSVKITSQELFLAAPNVYNIKYVNRYKDKNEDHPSLNKIKMCALKSCNVDYTPDGSYMTFNEPNATMTSYNLTLQFQELEPVTSGDYDNNNLDQIGY